jgi:hypothetical protein
MCMGCAAAYAAIAASTVTFSLSDFNEKQSGLQFAISFNDLSKTITTTPTGSSAITITQPQEKASAVITRGSIDRTSQQAI